MALSQVTAENSCCVRFKQSEGCIRVKHTGMIILAALAAIAVIAGVLLVLAGQGYNLGGINSLAKMIGPKWVYLGLGIAGVALILDTVFIAAQARDHKKAVPAEI